MHRSLNVTHRSSSISCFTFAIVTAETEGYQNAVRHGCLYINYLTHFCMFLMSIHCVPKTLHNWWWMSMGVVPLALKKWITACNSHLVGEARSSSIQVCPFKTEHRSGLGFVGVWRGSQAPCQYCWISHKAFLMAPAPCRHFTEMPLISVHHYHVLVTLIFWPSNG